MTHNVTVPSVIRSADSPMANNRQQIGERAYEEDERSLITDRTAVSTRGSACLYIYANTDHQPSLFLGNRGHWHDLDHTVIKPTNNQKNHTVRGTAIFDCGRVLFGSRVAETRSRGHSAVAQL
jgi:hypothetical protein